MNKTNINSINDQEVCSGSFSDKNLILSKETLGALEELGDVIKSIKRRMYNEGYRVVDGNISRNI